MRGTRKALFASWMHATVVESAPRNFDPSKFKGKVTRVYGWQIRNTKQGSVCIFGERVERHPWVGEGITFQSNNLLWYDEKIGWAASILDVFHLIGPRIRTKATKDSHDRP